MGNEEFKASTRSNDLTQTDGQQIHAEMRGVVSGKDLESASVDPSARSDEATTTLTLQMQNGRATETHLPIPDLQSASEDERATGIDLPKLNVPISNPLLEEVDMTDDVKNWLEGHNNVSVVVTGKSGVGKSTFINIFLGNQKAPVAGGLKPETEDVTGYKCERTINRHGVTLELFDTPGFETRKHWDNSLKKITHHFADRKNPDLVVFCVRMNEIPQSDDYNAMTSLSNAFGPAIWNNTCSNCVDTWKPSTTYQIPKICG